MDLGALALGALGALAPALTVLGLDALAVAAMDLDALALGALGALAPALTLGVLGVWVLVVFWVLGMPYQFLNKVFRVSYHAELYHRHV